MFQGDTSCCEVGGFSGWKPVEFLVGILGCHIGTSEVVLYRVLCRVA